MKWVDPYTKSMLRKILNGEIVLERQDDVLVCRECDIVVGRNAIMIYGMPVSKNDVIPDVGKVENIIQAAWLFHERIFAFHEIKGSKFD